MYNRKSGLSDVSDLKIEMINDLENNIFQFYLMNIYLLFEYI